MTVSTQAPTGPDYAAIKGRQQAAWSTGDYAVVGTTLAITGELLSEAAPRHPYTEALLSAVPKPDPRLRSKRIVLEGDVADPANPPSGCYFHPRCRYAMDICRIEAPPLREVEPGHFAACHQAETLQLRGVTAVGTG